MRLYKRSTRKKGYSANHEKKYKKDLKDAYVGRVSLIFLGVSLKGVKGGTAPDALPRDTRLPLRLRTSKSSSNLNQKRIIEIFRSLLTEGSDRFLKLTYLSQHRQIRHVHPRHS